MAFNQVHMYKHAASLLLFLHCFFVVVVAFLINFYIIQFFLPVKDYCSVTLCQVRHAVARQSAVPHMQDKSPHLLFLARSLACQQEPLKYRTQLKMQKVSAFVTLQCRNTNAMNLQEIKHYHTTEYNQKPK